MAKIRDGNTIQVAVMVDVSIERGDTFRDVCMPSLRVTEVEKSKFVVFSLRKSGVVVIESETLVLHATPANNNCII